MTIRGRRRDGGDVGKVVESGQEDRSILENAGFPVATETTSTSRTMCEFSSMSEP